MTSSKQLCRRFRVREIFQKNFNRGRNRFLAKLLIRWLFIVKMRFCTPSNSLISAQTNFAWNCKKPVFHRREVERVKFKSKRLKTKLTISKRSRASCRLLRLILNKTRFLVNNLNSYRKVTIKDRVILSLCGQSSSFKALHRFPTSLGLIRRMIEPPFFRSCTRSLFKYKPCHTIR